MTIRILLADNAYTVLVSVYVPTMANQDEHKEAFYQQLDEVIRSIPAGDKLIVLRDFNARIGSNHTAWAGITGQHGIGHENSNDKRLLSLYSKQNVSITNTFFQLNDVYKTTWIYPRSKHWHQIDIIICRKCDLRDFHITKAMRGAECSNGHLLLKGELPGAKKQKAPGQEISKKKNNPECSENQ